MHRPSRTLLALIPAKGLSLQRVWHSARTMTEAVQSYLVQMTYCRTWYKWHPVVLGTNVCVSHLVPYAALCYTGKFLGWLLFSYSSLCRHLDYQWITYSHNRNPLSSHNRNPLNSYNLCAISWSSQGPFLRQYSTCCGKYRYCASFCQQTSFCYLPFGACYTIAM